MLPVTTMYQNRLRQGAVKPDLGQAQVVEWLEKLAEALSQPRRRWRRSEPPRGLYIHGPVGRGKSMLMDLFFGAVAMETKRRVHFNAFMLEVHRLLHVARSSAGDPLPKVAAALADESQLLCFDEFQVNDIADAMILGRLFTMLLDRGVTIVATSNVPPEGLYRNGLQRALFLPFIALLNQRLDIVEIGPGIDHRLSRLAGRPVYFAPDDEAATSALDALFFDLAEGHESASTEIETDGRFLPVPLAAGRVARFTFAELCRQALGAGDYLALAEAFSIVMVEHVPRFDPAARNEALRFIALVDQLYEKHTGLALSAAADPTELYPENGPLAFEFRRTVSRLMEMQSEEYLSDSEKN